MPELGSTSGYLYPSVMLKEAGVEPGEIVEAGGHPQAVLAVYNGDVDFATSFFSPPLTDPHDKEPAMANNDNHIDELELARLGIQRVQSDTFVWGEYRYSNARDAIAAARREEKK